MRTDRAISLPVKFFIMIKLSLITFFFVCYSFCQSGTTLKPIITEKEIIEPIGSTHDNDQREIIKKIQAIADDHAANKQFEGTILIADKGEPIYHKAFGFRNRAQQIPNQPNTKFGIASITKMITAIIILQLVEEKKLRIKDTVEKLFPDFDIPKGEAITIHHLLLHISGLPNESNDMYRQARSPEAFVQSVLRKFRKNKNLGTYNYTNIDYVLLGLVIENICGQTWQEVVEERIIQPLQLGSTGFLQKGDYPEAYAWTYSIKKGRIRKDYDFHIENFYAAGSMYSTAMDLLKLEQAMYGDQLLSAASKELMFTSYPEYNYTGYSVWTYRYPFVETQPLIMERRGGIMGSNSVLVRILEDNKTIIILSNNDAFNPDSFGDPDNLREALIRTIAADE